MTSVCIFGSVARKSCDELSDKDVLVVASTRSACDQAALSWLADGWNVSTFTRDRLNKSAEFGSLFVQHLKCEGMIVEDDGYLRSLFQAYQPRTDYRDQLKDALIPLTWAALPAGYWSTLCLADIVFVSIRNAAVLSNGMSGLYHFDFGRIADQLADEAELSTSERDALVLLRSAKHAYRERLMSVELLTNWPAITTTAKKIERFLVEKHFGGLREYSFVGSFRPNAYHSLRRYELSLLAQYDPRDLDGMLPTDPKYKLWHLIRNPTDYDKLQQFGAMTSFAECESQLIQY